MMPAVKESAPQITNAIARMAVGKRGTNPVWKYSAITGMPAIRPSTIKMSASQPKNAMGLWSLKSEAIARNTFAPSPKVESFE